MNDDFTLGRWISILYRYGQSFVSRELAPYNIGGGQYVFLMTLYRRNGISQEEISEYVRIDKATTARAIQKLMREGYVERRTDESDKRAFKVYTTQKALDIEPALWETARKWNERISEGLTDQEKQTARELLQRMARNACLLERGDSK
jgi:DNA-binding MarR family transcriptional regulator